MIPQVFASSFGGVARHAWDRSVEVFTQGGEGRGGACPLVGA